NRQLGGTGVAVGVVHRDQFELSILWDADADADQALAEQHAVGGSPGLECGNICVRGVRAIYGPKDRIRPGRSLKSRLYIGRRDRPADRRLVAGHAGRSVGARAVERWTCELSS